MKGMKGISLSLETVVLLILMAIVLAALLAFFLSVFNPAKSKIDVLREKENLCLQYIAKDPGCSHAHEISAGEGDYGGSQYAQAKSAIEKIKSGVCNKPAGDPACTATDCTQAEQAVKACCSVYCG